MVGFPLGILVTVAVLFAAIAAATSAGIVDLIDITAGYPVIEDGGNVISLRFDQYSASGFQSKDLFLLARVDMQMKLQPNDSAGTVTTFYMSSNGSSHDEIDMEFLGNVSGQPYVLHTNVFAQGKGEKEMQFYLWFDPTTAFHNYTILWNSDFIILYVDGLPIRAFANLGSLGLPYPTNQQMKVFGSLWNADDWATQGGRVKTNWAHAPFFASYTNFSSVACPAGSTDPRCTNTIPSTSKSANNTPVLDDWTRSTMQGLQAKYMIYNYCTDFARFPASGVPPECSVKI